MMMMMMMMMSINIIMLRMSNEHRHYDDADHYDDEYIMIAHDPSMMGHDPGWVKTIFCSMPSMCLSEKQARAGLISQAHP